jgi:hypothetical protein
VNTRNSKTISARAKPGCLLSGILSESFHFSMLSLLLFFLFIAARDTSSFTFTRSISFPQSRPSSWKGIAQSKLDRLSYRSFSGAKLQMIFGKMFEEEGPLGKGITVGKVQVCLSTTDRSSSTSIFQLLERQANKIDEDSESPELAQMANEVCLALLRKKDDWSGACSSSKWFSENDAGKAESYFNDLANTEAAKFEKEYVPLEGSSSPDTGTATPTQVVVSLLLEVQGDSTK